MEDVKKESSQCEIYKLQKHNEIDRDTLQRIGWNKL